MKNVVFAFIILSAVIYGCKFSTGNNPGNITGTGITVLKKPVLAGREENEQIILDIISTGNLSEKLSVKNIELFFGSGSTTGNLSAITISRKQSGNDTDSFFSRCDKPGLKNIFRVKAELKEGENIFAISFLPVQNPDLTGKLYPEKVRIRFSDRSVKEILFPENSDPVRFGLLLRAAGQDSCHTYRIPGLITTATGTLIAVYDIRHNSSKDLQEDIDIGMSRSTDGGSSWEPMKVIMDMGTYGGRPERLNGAGDPCILYDSGTKTLMVAALWMSGASPEEMLWYASKPGIDPEVTGQFMLVKSSDDGTTWSAPENITSQVKDPSWQLLLQGPGRGLCMKDGTIVFPAQFKADIGTTAIDGGQYTCHSTIVYSADHGKSWYIGTGAKSNTTESQVVELPDGTLMLNMRDDRNRADKSETNGRAISTTSDMGKTWTVHPSSNSALPDPNCMASLISAEVMIDGIMKDVLFFSNPDNKSTRSGMTIKASLDNGMTWPEEFQVELCEPTGYGYSCLTMIDDSYVGILYEGIRELYFQKIAVADILKLKNK